MNKLNKEDLSAKICQYEYELMGQSYNEYVQYMQNVLNTLILESDESKENNE
jgi:hypothetical protein